MNQQSIHGESFKTWVLFFSFRLESYLPDTKSCRITEHYLCAPSLVHRFQCEGIIFQWRGQSFLIILITCRYVAVNVRDLCLFAIMDLGRWERIIPHTTTPATHLNHLALSASRFQRVSHTHLPSRWDNWACQNWRSWTPHKKPDEKRETWFIKNRRVYVLNYKFWGIVWPSCYILTSGRLFLSLCLL